MKRYASLAAARKSLIVQVSVLTAVVVLIVLAGRLLRHDRYDTDLVLSYSSERLDPSEITFLWEGEEIPVENFSLGYSSEEFAQASVLHIDMLPEKPGRYELTVLDGEGETLAVDVIRVGRFRTAMSLANGNFTGDEAVFFAGILFYLGLFVIMLAAYRRLKGALACSYEAILTCGVAIFSFVAMAVEIPVCVRHWVHPGFYPAAHLLHDIASGGKTFALVTSPFLFVFCILLIISNIALLRHERPRFRNILGLLLGILMIGGMFVNIRMAMAFFQGSEQEYRVVTTIENIVGISFSYAECILFSSMICGLRAARHVPAPDRDYILILGCGFRKDGSLPPLLRGRVEKAMEFWHRQKEATGKEAVVIPSGGQGRGEPMAEAEAMRRYMISTGFSEEAIVPEDKSANTYQNMEFSKRIIENRNSGTSKVNTAFVTTNYHVFRSGVWAGLAGLDAEGLGSRTKWWFWPNAFVRECVGLLRNRIVPEIICLIILIALFGVFSQLSV